MAMERAKEIQATLSQEHPSFIKVMQRSHVKNPFYMMPPSQFCQKYLPKTDETLVFEVESGKSYSVKLLGQKRAFSGGWMGFAKAEKLVENDVLVFHLVGHCQFKVCIVRASGFTPVDEAPRVVKADACATATEVKKKRTFESDKKCLKFVPVEIPTNNIEASNSLRNKSIRLNNSKSSNMEGSNPKSSEMMGEYLDKSSDYSKALSPEAMDRAIEIQASLSPEHPSFIKHILKSHLSNPFRMCPPFQFAQKYLPVSEKIFVFEVENGTSYDVKFLCTKLAFTDGWKGFSEAEKLLKNDILVFHLVSPSKFKVYVVRANGLAPADEAPKVIEIDDCETEKTIVTEKAGEREEKRIKFVGVDLTKENIKVRNSSIEKSLCFNINNSPEVEGFQSSQAIPKFKDFKIVVNGTTIEIPETVQVDYYKLCCSQQSYLHRHLIKDIDRELATSIISKTVSISNTIRDSKISTPQEDITSWHKMLDGFEVFGMDVGFIKERLNQLSGLTIDVRRYKEAENKRDRFEKKITELEKVKRRLDGEIEGMKKVAAESEIMYEELATAPWGLQKSKKKINE